MATALELAKLFGKASITETAYGVEIDSGRGFIRLATDSSIGEAHASLATHPAVERPIWHVLTIGVDDREATAAYLASVGINAERIGNVVRVKPADARGLNLEFIA